MSKKYKDSDVRHIRRDDDVRAIHLATMQAQRLSSLYTLREPMEIAQFFTHYSTLEPLLIEISHKITDYFSDAKLSLEFVAEPDSVNIQDVDGDLVVSTTTHLTPLEAVQRLEQFYEQWWLFAANDGENKGKICFNLE